MKLTKLLAMTGVITLSSTTLLTTVLAEEGDGGKYTSNGVIKFEPSKEETKPVDPTNPEKPIDPIDPTNPDEKPNPGTPGPLSIDFASSLDFGIQKISSNDEVYMAAPQKASAEDGTRDVPNYVQVTDNRGSLAGWQLQVQQMEQFKSEDNKLTGATITFDNSEIVSASESAKAETNGRFTLDSENKSLSNVMTAKKDTGAGTTLNVFGNTESMTKSISLAVPGKTTKYATEYRTVFNWVLTDAPGE